MNLRNRSVGGVLRPRELKRQTTPLSLVDRWRKAFHRKRRIHDPLLVLNMSAFNVADGWKRTFNQIKVHENGV